MGQLELTVLGLPRVRHDDHVLSFATRKAQALLVHLAVEGGFQARDRLAALFWPESDRDHARAMLRYTLTVLRRVLADGSDVDHLVIERDAVGVDFDSGVEVDVQGLPPLADLGLVTLDQLRTAATRCRGEFLEGLTLPDAPEFDEWTSVQRQLWRDYTEQVLGRLAALEAKAGAYVEAIAIFQRWLAVNPLNEDAHRQLIAAYLAHGDRSAALRAYEECRRVLGAELGIAPSSETAALVERIRSSVPPPRETLPGIPRSGVFEGPLVGRDAEFARLGELYTEAAHGRTQVAILKGEPGIGKSRLAREFVAGLVEQGGDVLQGRAFETGGRLPYQALVDALRPRLDRENAPDDLLSDVWLVELGRLLPELHERYPDLPEPAIEESAARLRLFEAISRFGQALARRATLVLYLDDIQWSDVGALDALQYAVRRWTDEGSPILVLLCVRTEALAGVSSVADWVTTLPRAGCVTHVELGSLSAEDTLHFVDRVAVTSEPSQITAFADWLYAETTGQPLFVVETVRALLEQQALVSRSGTEDRWAVELSPDLMDRLRHATILPAGVRQVITMRLTQLSAPARDLLAAGAVLGQGFSFDQLCQVAQLPEVEALHAVDEVLRAHVVREATSGDGSAAGAYVFAHDRIRDVAYDGAGAARRRVFHRRALQALRSSAQPAQLAHHALMAGLDDEALRFLEAAGDRAVSLLVARDALLHYQRALEIAVRVVARARVVALHAKIGKALARLGRWIEARQELETSLAELGADQAEHRAEVLVDLLEVCWWWLDVPAVRQRAAELAELVESMDRPDLHAAAFSWLAPTMSADGDVAGSIVHAEHWFGRARELGVAPPAPVQAYTPVLYYWLGRVEDAVEHSRASVEAARAASHASATMFALPNLGMTLASNGKYAEAAEAFEEARRFGREHGIGTLLARSIAMSAGYHLDLFDFAGNEQVAEEARELARSLSFAPPVISAGIDLMLNYARQQEVGRAEQLVDEVADAASRATGWHGWLWRIRLGQARAEIALARGDWDAVLDLTADAIEESRRRGRVKYGVLGLTTRAQALRALGRTSAAIEALRASVAIARGVADLPLILRPALALLDLDADGELATEIARVVERISVALPDAAMHTHFQRGVAAHLRLAPRA